MISMMFVYAALCSIVSGGGGAPSVMPGEVWCFMGEQITVLEVHGDRFQGVTTDGRQVMGFTSLLTSGHRVEDKDKSGQ